MVIKTDRYTARRINELPQQEEKYSAGGLIYRSVVMFLDSRREKSRNYGERRGVGACPVAQHSIEL